MAEYTNNLHLIKPTQSENYDVDVANTNNEIIDTAIGSKVSKVAGKGLSSNDFTDGYKSKLDALIEEDDEIEALQKRIVDLENNQLTGTESGTSINIDDSADYQVREIQVKGNSVQDGTPTPTNPVEIESAGDNGYITEAISNSDNTQSQSYTIPCQQPMRSIGNVKDTFVKISNTWYERHYIGQVIFSGSNDESWYMTTDGSFKRFSISVNDLENFQSRKANLKSDYFNGNTVGAVGSMYSYDSYVYLYPDSSITSVDSFKSWLSSNNVEVIYVSSTPTDIACTQEQVTALEAIEKARTYKNVTNILSENETPAYIETTYVKDLETVIDNLVS